MTFVIYSNTDISSSPDTCITRKVCSVLHPTGVVEEDVEDIRDGENLRRRLPRLCCDTQNEELYPTVHFSFGTVSRSRWTPVPSFSSSPSSSFV